MLITHDKKNINGGWLPPAQATYVNVINSASEDVMASVCMCSELEVDQAVISANAAFVSWSILCSEERQVYLAKDQKQLAEKLEEIAFLIAQEVGTPLAVGTALGPLISAAQKQRVLYYIQTGIEEGARLLVGGVDKPKGIDKGFYVKPTIFSDVNPNMTIAKEEIFGTVICLIKYQDEADAIKIANDSIYGLSGAVWSKDVIRAKHVARQLRTGQVHINGSQLNPLAPFGSFKQSGNGRGFGKYGLQEFLEFKAIFN